MVPGYGRTVIPAAVCITPSHEKRPTQGRPFLAPAIYALTTRQFSRPMTGHTPQKLPAFAAISCIIALRAQNALRALNYDTTLRCLCQGQFYKILQKFGVYFVPFPQRFFDPGFSFSLLTGSVKRYPDNHTHRPCRWYARSPWGHALG